MASLLKGYNPNLSPLFQQPTFSPPLSQQFTIPPQPTVQAGTSAKIGLGRRLLQDNLAVRSPSSAIGKCAHSWLLSIRFDSEVSLSVRALPFLARCVSIYIKPALAAAILQ